jgi:PAS domain S-box-containing protein
MRHGQSTWYENQLVPILRNGHLEDVYWTWSDSPVRDAEGHVLGVLVTCNETTDRVIAERELHQRARDLRESERIGKMGSWRLVLATGELTWSDEVYRIMEHDPSLPVLNYATNPELIDPNSHHRLQAAVNQCIATGQSYELDVKMYLQHDGRTVWLATRGEPVFGPDGSITELRGSVRDITDRKLVEEALRASEERLQLALETASLGTWSYDAATGLSTGDPTMLNIFGSSLAAGDFAYWIAFVHPDDRQSVGEKFHAAISHNGPYESEYRILRRTDGEVRWIRSRGRVLLQPDKPLCMVVIVEDITERKLTEAALLRTEKLAAVGRLAASIAHEINNPLESVTNLLFLAKSSAIDPQAIDYLTLAEQELSRASAITTQTLRFHRQSSRPTQVTVDDLLVNVLGILRGRFLNANVTVHLRQRTNLSVLCFDGEIR